jgi:hypothetical protein
MGSFVWRIMGTGGAILAGIVANKLVTQLWKKAGRDEVVDPRDPRTPWKDAIAFAALTGLAVGITRTLATRKAAQYYEKSAGHLPKAMQEDNA